MSANLNDLGYLPFSRTGGMIIRPPAGWLQAYTVLPDFRFAPRIQNLPQQTPEVCDKPPLVDIGALPLSPCVGPSVQ